MLDLLQSSHLNSSDILKSCFPSLHVNQVFIIFLNYFYLKQLSKKSEQWFCSHRPPVEIFMQLFPQVFWANICLILKLSIVFLYLWRRDTKKQSKQIKMSTGKKTNMKTIKHPFLDMLTVLLAFCMISQGGIHPLLHYRNS